MKRKAGSFALTVSEFRLPERTGKRFSGILRTLVIIWAVVFGWWVTGKGLGITPDSVDYISSGLNLASGKGLAIYSGVPLTLFPPGLPAILALGHLLGITVQVVARLVNIASIASATLLSMRIAEKYVCDLGQILLTGSIVAVSFGGTYVATFVWSEALFTPLVLLSFLAYFRLARNPQSWSALALLGASTAAAFMDRYVGLVLIPVFTISLGWMAKSRGWRAIVSTSSKVLIATSVVPVASVLRNLATDGTALGFRPSSIQTFGPTIESFFRQMLILLSGGTSASKVTNWWLIVGIAICYGFVLLLAWKGSLSFHRDSASTPAQNALLPLGLFLVIYSSYLIYAQLTTAIDAFGLRLLSPMFVPGVLFVVVAINAPRFLPGVLSASRRLVIGSGVLTLVLLCQTVGSVAYLENLRASQGKLQIASPIERAAINLPSSVEFFTNISYKLWALHPRDGMLDVPLRGWYRSNVSYSVSPSFVKTVSCTPTLLVWATFGSPWFYPPRELKIFVNLKVVRHYTDGTIYRLGPRDGIRTCLQ